MIAFFSGMGPLYAEETKPENMYAGSPGVDFAWYTAVLDSMGNVKEINLSPFSP